MSRERKDSIRQEPINFADLDNKVNNVGSAEDAQELLDQIVIFIQDACSQNEENIPTNQRDLNVSFRNYYALLKRFNLPDVYFTRLTQRLHDKADFLMLNAILVTTDTRVDFVQLGNACQAALVEAIYANSKYLLAIVKSLNLIHRKQPAFRIDISLENVCYLLQCQCPGLRDETLTLYCNIVKDAQRAKQDILCITEFWPWTNKNKYYLLSCILNIHPLHTGILPIDDGNIFRGIRLALNYKRLFAASQYIVKTLSSQESEELLQLSTEILIQGSRQEITNFFSQWFSRIMQKDKLFLLLQQQLAVGDTVNRFVTFTDQVTHHYRFILIFIMFSSQVFQMSKLDFFKSSTELRTRCFDLEVELQLLVLKFVVDNLPNLAIEDCLEFISRFIETHRGTDSAQVRNSILGKLPSIFNYISKIFNRFPSDYSISLKECVKNFFIALHKIIERDIYQTSYQPKIFALKLFEILVKTFYAQSPVKNAKNCNIVQNQKLGEFLMTEHIFNSAQVKSKLLLLLNDPHGFDDALDLLVSLLKELGYNQTEEITVKCQSVVNSCDLDECNLSSIYSQVAINTFVASKSSTSVRQLFFYCFETLKQELEPFEADPLLACKSRNHLFGYLQVMNICVGADGTLLQSRLNDILDLVENIVVKILKMLNICKSDGVTKHLLLPAVSDLASFEEMDGSLQILVKQSAFTGDNSADFRKFLMISFWFTLKACCEVASTIGCHLVSFNESDEHHIYCVEQCLKINTLVLTKCRHKGAIEVAGITIGKLTKYLTMPSNLNSETYPLLFNCINSILLEREHKISTTRRGAGFSIMFLHVIKNEQNVSRPLLHRAVRIIFAHLDEQNIVSPKGATCNYDCLESLYLHYLCVLVKDTELREVMIDYYDDIMMAAIKNIDNPEWTICNAALQLFGALVPKIVGQKQATDFQTPTGWEPTEVTFREIILKLPKTCKYILNYCDLSTANPENHTNGARVRSMILFLSFFSQVEHHERDSALYTDSSRITYLQSFRELMWSLLGHRVEKVRKLAAVCFIRAHGFRYSLPLALLQIVNILPTIEDGNLFQGLTYVLIEGIRKFLNESMFLVERSSINVLFEQLKLKLSQDFHVKGHNSYTFYKLLELMPLLGLTEFGISEFIDSCRNQNFIGSNLFHSIVTEMAKN